MEIPLNPGLFPQLDHSVRVHWAPILFEPISGSYERLVIGVVVANDNGFHMEPANRLDRLNCFYGQEATGAINAIKIAHSYLEADLANRALKALTNPDPAITGITIGEVREAEGGSLASIAQNWMAALSSLYVVPDFESSAAPSYEIASTSNESGDRLPFMVCDYVKSRRAGFSAFFSRDLREGKQRRTKGSSHKILIDFSGSRLVANFGTLKAGSLTSSVNLIKRRLWDLKVQRDGEPNAVINRQHEMILQRPSSDDPQITEKQQTNLSEAFEALEGQADQEELRLRALGTVPQIGDYILSAEAKTDSI